MFLDAMIEQNQQEMKELIDSGVQLPVDEDKAKQDVQELLKMWHKRTSFVGQAIKGPDEFLPFPIKTMMISDLVCETEPDGVLRLGKFYSHLLIG